jgi:NAD(P)-dependent dehydrogenase (short-subunit alcohol dehydrogenase family)
MATDARRRAILVTGASRGIGLETANSLAQAGFDVWAGVRDSAVAERMRSDTAARGIALTPVILDVTSDASVAEAVATIREKTDVLYGLVNNAGVTARAAFEEFPEHDVRRIFEVNLFGAMRVTRGVLPLLRKSGAARIVFISSVGGRIGAASVAPYVASKFGVEGLAESLYLELRPLGIGVVIVEPGIVKTEIWDESRRVLPCARDEASPYHKLFWAGERQAEMLLKSSTLTTADVARQIVHAMTTAKPRLRYVVGRRAALVLALRRHLPGELFERFYFGEYLRRIISASDAAGR